MRKTLLLCFVVVTSAAAQTSPAKPAATPPGPPAIKFGDVTFSGSFRSRLEMWDWFDADADGDYAFSGNILRFGFTRTGKSVDWQLEMAAPFLLGLPENAVGPGAQGQLGLGATYYTANNRSQNSGMVFAKQAWIRWKNRSHSIRFGRFEFSDGGETVPADATLAWVKRERISQRLLGPFGWSHVGRSFDGAHYVWNRGRTNFTAMGALATRGAFQTDGWGNLKTGVGYAALTRALVGKNHSGDVRVFGIYYHDARDIVKTDNRPLALRRLEFDDIKTYSFGGHWIHRYATTAGTFDTLAWGLGQTGKWGTLDHAASAFAFEAGWQPGGLPSLRPWLRGGYYRGSGDKNPNDDKHGTFVQMLPTPRPYDRFPFFNSMNNEDITAMLVLRPHRAVTVRTEAHWLRLAERNDLWYLGGGAFQPWSFGFVGRATNGAGGLANLYDLSVDYNVNARWTVTGYVAHANGHSIMQTIYPRGKNANFGYLEVLYRF